MNKVHVLDCTLRDGGYCNQWNFGNKNIKKIIKGLIDANIDIIECGFLTGNILYDLNHTKFTLAEQISQFIPQDSKSKIFVAMINYGDYDLKDLPVNDGQSIDGIRVAFHKHDRVEALKQCEMIKNKGYKVFIQAMVSLSYSDEEFIEMIHRVNELAPYAFYIVDSFGVMKEKDLLRFIYIIEHNLNKEIWIGFHSHNNMQLSYSNAQVLMKVQTNRNLIIDASVYGMGRGAGNLNTELLVNYLNEYYAAKYEIKPLLTIIDEILNQSYQRNYWGYSLSNYLSASHNVHPDYAGYLDNKKTLTVEGIDEIFAMMEEEKKSSFNKTYIENLYLKYMTAGKVFEERKEELKKRLFDMQVCLIGPGKSSLEEKEKIQKYIVHNPCIVISTNFDYEYADTDYIFISNLRRFRELEESIKYKCIITSNIPSDHVYFQTKYFDLLSSEEVVRDNAGLMAIRFLIHYGVKEVILAGFDGYSHDIIENYADDQMAMVTNNNVLDAMNAGITKVLKEYAKEIKIDFLTATKYI